MGIYSCNNGFMWTKNYWIIHERKNGKTLVISALNDAYQRAGKPTDVILHSDRGVQYCSNDYQTLLKKYGFVCSMSRKGNC